MSQDILLTDAPSGQTKATSCPARGHRCLGERRIHIESQLSVNTFLLTVVVVSRCDLRNIVILSSPQFYHHHRLFSLRSAFIPSPQALYNVSLTRPSAFASPRMEVSDSWIPVSCSYCDKLRHTPRIRRELCQKFGLRKSAKTSY